MKMTLEKKFGIGFGMIMALIVALSITNFIFMGEIHRAAENFF